MAAAGCSMPGEGIAEEPYVRGPIADMAHRATSSGLFVMGGPGSVEPCGIRATVDANTRYQRRARDGALSEATLADLSVGDTVEVYVVGPIAESCPVQGKASRIVEIAP